MEAKRKFIRRALVFVAIAALVALLNAAAWHSTAFSDWYIANIFPVWVNLYGRFTGLFPFSVGEWLLGAGVALVAAAALLGIVWAVLGIVLLIRRIFTAKGQKGQLRIGGFRCFTVGFYRFFVWTLLTVSLIMTLNCFILYHASTFSEHYFGEDDGEYELTELIAVYNMVAEQCNYLASVMERDESGMVIYVGGDRGLKDAEYKKQLRDMADRARELMKELGKEYPQLDGYYPRPKALLSSDFMCQQYMQGYYFPFSMEANYNDVMHILNIPATMCHELAHLRGYIFEDEANFIGYLACVQSEDAFIQYSGYLSVLNYLNNDLYKAWQESRVSYEAAVAVIQPVAVDGRVWEDNIFVTQEEWDRINGKALINTEIVDEVSDAFIDTNLKVNGVTDGAVSYSRVVRLLLQYYRQ